jgi:hypothetical protein
VIHVSVQDRHLVDELPADAVILVGRDAWQMASGERKAGVCWWIAGGSAKARLEDRHFPVTIIYTPPRP